MSDEEAHYRPEIPDPPAPNGDRIDRVNAEGLTGNHAGPFPRQRVNRYRRSGVGLGELVPVDWSDLIGFGAESCSPAVDRPRQNESRDV
jgi:hypothetical protein